MGEIFRDRNSGHRFIARSGNLIWEYFISQGIPEWPLIQWCEQFLAKDKIFVDIGAHMGTYSIHLASHCREVHSFECQKNTYLALCGGIVLNGRENITPHQIALGSENKTMTLSRVSDDGGGSTLLDSVEASFGKEEVIVQTLDSFNLCDIGFMKIDVEGWELEVLRGAQETLQKSDWPSFIFETWPQDEERRRELFQFIEKELGYKNIPIQGYNNMFLATKK